MLVQGVFVGNIPCLAMAKLAFDNGVNLEFAVRSENEQLCELIVQSLS